MRKCSSNHLCVHTSPASGVFWVSTSPWSGVLCLSSAPASGVLWVSTSPASGVLCLSTSPTNGVLFAPTTPATGDLCLSTAQARGVLLRVWAPLTQFHNSRISGFEVCSSQICSRSYCLDFYSCMNKVPSKSNHNLQKIKMPITILRTWITRNWKHCFIHRNSTAAWQRGKVISDSGARMSG